MYACMALACVSIHWRLVIANVGLASAFQTRLDPGNWTPPCKPAVNYINGGMSSAQMASCAGGAWQGLIWPWPAAGSSLGTGISFMCIHGRLVPLAVLATTQCVRACLLTPLHCTARRGLRVPAHSLPACYGHHLVHAGRSDVGTACLHCHMMQPRAEPSEEEQPHSRTDMRVFLTTQRVTPPAPSFERHMLGAPRGSASPPLNTQTVQFSTRSNILTVHQ